FPPPGPPSASQGRLPPGQPPAVGDAEPDGPRRRHHRRQRRSDRKRDRQSVPVAEVTRPVGQAVTTPDARTGVSTKRGTGPVTSGRSGITARFERRGGRITGRPA